MPNTWNEILTEHKEQLGLDNILSQLNNARLTTEIYPKQENLFKAFELTPYDKVKVVILGQDPYPTPNVANGLAFSVNKNTPLPQSLKNIFKELQEDLGIVRTNGDLSDWAEQGVFLLNTSLSVVAHKPNSMTELWNDFTNHIVYLLGSREEPIIFLLWGNNAKKAKRFITNKNHYILESAHPSPLSAYRGFFGSKPFSKINEILLQNNQRAIVWGY